MELGLGVTFCEIQPPARRWNAQWSTGSDPPTKPNLSRLITSTPPPGGEVDRPLEGEMYGMLDKKTKKLQRRVRPHTCSLCPRALVFC